MTKIKFTRERTDGNGNTHIEASDGNEKGRDKAIAAVKKDINKPVDPSRIKNPNSIWRSKAKIVTEAYPFSKVARYQNPESLYEIAKDYFIECENMPYIEHKRVEHDKPMGPEVKQDFIEKKQVYTLTSFLNFSGITTWQWKENYKKHPAFMDVVDFIERTIADDKYKGAISGFYNATIVSRDLGLEEKTRIAKDDNKTDQITIDIDKLDDDKLDSLMGILDSLTRQKEEAIEAEIVSD